MSSATALSGAELAELLRRGHASDPWYGPATVDLIDVLDCHAAASRPYHDAHSAWEIVLHMTAWQREVLRRLRGLPPQPPEDGDWPSPPPPTPEAWQAARSDLRQSLEELATAVQQLTSAAFLSPVGSTRDRALGSGVTVAQMVAGLLQHNAYHTGQIALLLKNLPARS